MNGIETIGHGIVILVGEIKGLVNKRAYVLLVIKSLPMLAVSQVIVFWACNLH